MRPGEEGLNGTHGFPECFAAVAALLSMRATSPVGYAPRSEKRGTEEAVGGGRRARRGKRTAESGAAAGETDGMSGSRSSAPPGLKENTPERRDCFSIQSKWTIEVGVLGLV